MFAANYELKHIADKDAMFQNPQFVSDESLIYDGVAHIDAAYDGADGTAFTIFHKLPDGRIIGFGKRWDKHVDDCLTQISLLHKKYRAGTIENEDNADKGYLKKELKDIGLPVHGYHESMNKFVKISTYLRKNWSDIYWLEDTDPEYINEILITVNMLSMMIHRIPQQACSERCRKSRLDITEEVYKMFRVPAGTEMTPELLAKYIGKHKREIALRYKKLHDAYENEYEIQKLPKEGSV
ncbi:MAG: hypothetical protein V8S08_01165 [Lachnoclostridium sp.]